MSPAGSVLIIAERDHDNSLLPISLEAVRAAGQLAQAWGSKLAALIMGSETTAARDALKNVGLDIVYTADHPLLEDYHPDLYMAALKQALEEIAPKAIVMGHTLSAVDLAPRLAFSLNTGLLTDCIGLEIEGDEIGFVKPVYSSNIMAVYSLNTEPYILTLRSGAWEAAEESKGPSAELVPVEVALESSLIKTEVLERVIEDEEGVKLGSAEVIISGGRGMGGPEGFKQLAALAKPLKAAVGASRPPCDLGWVSPKAQIGQTGEIVRPMVYVAVGISGATKHLAGMSSAKTIVAINKDPQATIFKIADYGVVGKYEEVLPAFQEALMSKEA